MIHMTRLNNSFNYYRQERKVRDWAIIRQLFFVQGRFLQQGRNNGFFEISIVTLQLLFSRWKALQYNSIQYCLSYYVEHYYYERLCPVFVVYVYGKRLADKLWIQDAQLSLRDPRYALCQEQSTCQPPEGHRK